MAPFFGNSVACRIAEAHEIGHSTLVLGDWRAAQRIEFWIGRDGEEAFEDGRAGGGGAAAGGGAAGGRPATALRVNGRGGGSSSSSIAGEAGGGGGGGAPSDAGSEGQRSVVSGGTGGFKVWVVNTHLDHEHPDNRQRQVGGAAAGGAAGGGVWGEVGAARAHAPSGGGRDEDACTCRGGRALVRGPSCPRSLRGRLTAPTRQGPPPSVSSLQALAVCDWMDREKHDCAAIILCGGAFQLPAAACQPAAALRATQARPPSVVGAAAPLIRCAAL